MASNDLSDLGVSIVYIDGMEIISPHTTATAGSLLATDSSSASSSSGTEAEGYTWWDSTPEQQQATLAAFKRLLTAFSAEHLIIGPVCPDASKRGRFVLRSAARRLTRFGLNRTVMLQSREAIDIVLILHETETAFLARIYGRDTAKIARRRCPEIANLFAIASATIRSPQCQWSSRVSPATNFVCARSAEDKGFTRTTMVRQRTKKIHQEEAASPAKSTRSQVRARVTEPEQKKRAPQRCRKCPDAPLRAECSHSATGRRRALEVEASIAALPRTTPPPGDAENTHRETTNPFIYDTPAHHPRVWSTPVTPRASQENGSPATPLGRTSPIEDFDNESSPIFNFDSSPIIDPALLALSREAAATTALLLTPTTSTQKSQSLSTRPTLSNPFHDFVKGVYRGHEPHTIIRKRARPIQIDQTSKSSKTFVENVNALVEKCEDVSVRTGAWLFFGAQHPGARGAAINYASPRLRRDGGEDANELATNFMTLINSVLASKRSDTMELQKKLELERQENARIRSQLEQAKVTAEENEAALQEVRSMLASYRAQ